MENQKTKVEQFYKWMKKINSIYLKDNEKMVTAIRKIALNN